MTKKILNLFFPLFCLVLCLSFPAVCGEGVRRGLHLALQEAGPALYPSLVLSALLIREIKADGEKSFLLPFFLGLVCGFPVGASAVAGLVEQKKLSVKDGNRLLIFCNNASPAFLIAFCGQQVLGDWKKGLFLYATQSALCLFCLLFFFGKRLFSRKKREKIKEENPPVFWKNIPSALRDSTNSFIYIISCIIFFSFLTELIRHLFSLDGVPFALLGIFTELCGGISRIHHFPASLALSLCALGCGWGGLCVHVQTAGILEKSPLSLRHHLAGKILFSLLLFSAAIFFQKLL